MRRTAQCSATAENLGRPEFGQRPDEIDVPVRAGELSDRRCPHAARRASQRKRSAAHRAHPLVSGDRLPFVAGTGRGTDLVAKTQRLAVAWSARGQGTWSEPSTPCTTAPPRPTAACCGPSSRRQLLRRIRRQPLEVARCFGDDALRLLDRDLQPCRHRRTRTVRTSALSRSPFKLASGTPSCRTLATSGLPAATNLPKCSRETIFSETSEPDSHTSSTTASYNRSIASRVRSRSTTNTS